MTQGQELTRDMMRKRIKRVVTNRRKMRGEDTTWTMLDERDLDKAMREIAVE